VCLKKGGGRYQISWLWELGGSPLQGDPFGGGRPDLQPHAVTTIELRAIGWASATTAASARRRAGGPAAHRVPWFLRPRRRRRPGCGGRPSGVGRGYMTATAPSARLCALRLLALGVGALAAPFALGCGGGDAARVEDTLRKGVNAQLERQQIEQIAQRRSLCAINPSSPLCGPGGVGVPDRPHVSEVGCPSGLKLSRGGRFTCVTRDDAGRRSGEIAVTVLTGERLSLPAAAAKGVPMA